MISVGIIGFGSFGAFLAEKLEPFCDVRAYDQHVEVAKQFSSSIDDICTSDYIVFAVPLESYEEVCNLIADRLDKDSVIIDISSVKAEPIKLLKKLLPGKKIVVTHPLFGPQSAANGFAGHTLVMCPEASDPLHFNKIKGFCLNLGMKVVEKSAIDHDKDMAYAQGLTFFVARALMRMDIHAVELQTPSFKKLLDLAELESHHSDELFSTIQKGNIYTEKVRGEFTEQVEQIMKELA